MGNTYAVTIAVETYQQDSIKPVRHGIADANGFRDVLLKNFGVPDANIKLWLDSDARLSSSNRSGKMGDRAPDILLLTLPNKLRWSTTTLTSSRLS